MRSDDESIAHREFSMPKREGEELDVIAEMIVIPGCTHFWLDGQTVAQGSLPRMTRGRKASLAVGFSRGLGIAVLRGVRYFELHRALQFAAVCGNLNRACSLRGAAAPIQVYSAHGGRVMWLPYPERPLVQGRCKPTYLRHESPRQNPSRP